MERTTIDFGIDLGTTNSTICVIDGTDARVIPNKTGATTTPSAVWINKREQMKVGGDAKFAALVDDPENADVEFKLRMGLGEEGRKVFQRSGREMSPEELSAEVLKELKKDVHSSMGEDIRAAVITVPAAFELPQTNATQKSATLAGFERSPLLLEPVAASLAYGFQTESENVYWLVYDFGGGTFDAAVMRVCDGLIQVVNHDGDNHLGGKLLDWDIVTKLAIPALTSEYNLPDFRRGNPRWANALRKLKYYAEQAKIEVCRNKASQEMWVEGLCQDEDGKDVDFAFTLTPEGVEEVSRPYIERSLRLCRKTLQDKGLQSSDLERILMVGGTTLNPWVRDAVQNELGSQVEVGIDPVTVVARGAAIFASTQILPRDGSVKIPDGTWEIQIDHEPVGNVNDPDIGGRVIPPAGRDLEGYTIEFVDLKTQWRSGLVQLGADGVFMTQLFADEKRRCEYSIELCDPTGTRLSTAPSQIAYTLGIVPDKPPASMSIGVALWNDEMRPYITKGTRLPARRTNDHRITKSLRSGDSTDVIRIPVLEGENPRATRNHGIGALVIRGSDIRRDLPMGTEIEVTLIIDESQQVKVQAYVPLLDEDFIAIFDLKGQHDSLETLRDRAREQKARLTTVRDKAGTESASGLRANAALARIDDENLLEEVDELTEAATDDQDALSQLDRRIRDLATAIDGVEDALEWPTLLAEAQESLERTKGILDEYGDPTSRHQFQLLRDELQRAIDSGDSDLLRRAAEDLDILRLAVLNQRPEFHVGRYNYLVEQVDTMRDRDQADKLISQGKRAINANDLEALKAANRQLLALLPRDDQKRAEEDISHIAE